MSGKQRAEDIRAQVRAVVAAQGQIDEDKLSDQADFLEDLHLDSIQMIEILLDLEERFQIRISDEEGDRLTCVQAICDYVAKH